MEVMQSNNKYFARLNSYRRRSQKSTQRVVVHACNFLRLHKSTPQHLLGSRRYIACTSSRASSSTSGLPVALPAAPFNLNASSVFRFGPFNLNAHTCMLQSTHPAAFCSHVPLPALHRGASLTTGSNRSLRSLGRAEPAP